MSREEFKKKFNELRDMHGIIWSWDCDLLSIAGINAYSKEDIFISNIDVDSETGRANGISDIIKYYK